MSKPSDAESIREPLPGDCVDCRHYQACRRCARYHGTDEWRGCRPGCLSRQDAEEERRCKEWDEVLG